MYKKIFVEENVRLAFERKPDGTFSLQKYWYCHLWYVEVVSYQQCRHYR